MEPPAVSYIFDVVRAFPLWRHHLHPQVTQGINSMKLSTTIYIFIFSFLVGAVLRAIAG